MKKVLNKKYLWIIMISFLIIIVLRKEIIKYDSTIYSIFINQIRTDNLTKIMKLITNLGSALFLILICLLCIIKNKKTGLYITLNLILITTLNQIIKYIVQRARPSGYELITEKGYSFPSGHSMVSAAFYGFIIYFILKFVKNKKVKITLSVLLILLILLIGFSRIYLGVHYASDVVGGFLISCIYLPIFVKLLRWHE